MSVDDLTTALELAGLLLILAAVGVALWPLYPPAALAAVGAGLLGISGLVTYGYKKRRRRS